MTEGPVGGGDAKTPKHRLRRWAIGVLVAVIVLGIAGELFARYWIGLGDPPLVQRDAQMKYLFKADQTCHRFGHLIKYNHYSMQSEDFPEQKSDPRELRIMMIGNSIINGGALTDQSQIASELLRSALPAELGRPVVVGNISAGGWGPPNELAYLKRYGLFDADLLIIVLTSHDYANLITSELVGIDPSLPDRKPPLALWEGFSRYLLPKLRARTVPTEGYVANKPKVDPAHVEACMNSLREMIAMARQSGATVIMAHQPFSDERPDSPSPGAQAVAQEARRAGVPFIEFGEGYAEARRRGEEPYSDGIHPNAAGQRIMTAMLKVAIEQAMRSSLATQPATTSTAQPASHTAGQP